MCIDPIQIRTSSPVNLGRLWGRSFFSGTVLKSSPRFNVSRRGKYARNIKRLFNVNRTSSTTNVRIRRPMGPNAFCIEVAVNRPSERRWI